jgi:hypothetical protein
MKTDRNGRKNPISTSISIFFDGNGIGFGKYGFGNGIGTRGCTETNKNRFQEKKDFQSHASSTTASIIISEANGQRPHLKMVNF